MIRRTILVVMMMTMLLSLPAYAENCVCEPHTHRPKYVERMLTAMSPVTYVVAVVTYPVWGPLSWLFGEDKDDGDDYSRQ